MKVYRDVDALFSLVATLSLALLSTQTLFCCCRCSAVVNFCSWTVNVEIYIYSYWYVFSCLPVKTYFILCIKVGSPKICMCWKRTQQMVVLVFPHSSFSKILEKGVFLFGERGHSSVERWSSCCSIRSSWHVLW